MSRRGYVAEAIAARPPDTEAELRGQLANQARVALEVAGIFGASSFRIRAHAHEIAVQPSRDGRGFSWRCRRCSTAGAFSGPTSDQDRDRGGFHYLALARFTRDHTGATCPTQIR